MRVGRAFAPTILAVLVAVGLAACSSSQPYFVSLSVEPGVKGATLIIEGTTSLPDGARLGYIAVSEVATWRHFAGCVSCSGGRFRTGEDVSSWPPGTAKVTITFHPEAARQPRELRNRCGRNGRLLAGSNVVRRGAGKVVQACGVATLPGRVVTGLAQSSVEAADDARGAPGPGSEARPSTSPAPATGTTAPAAST